MNVLLPIETISRELDFKIFLAGMLARQELNVYVGQHDYIHDLVKRVQGGIYVGKNVFTKSSDKEDGSRYYHLKDKGFDIVYLHEEGAVFRGGEEQWKQSLKYRYDPSIFDEKDRLCSWGEFQRQYDMTRCNAVPIHVTGHPRFDLYKAIYRDYYKSNVKEIKSKYGRYVLINGNYAISNHGLGLGYYFSEAGGYAVNDEKKRMEQVGFYAYKARQMTAMVELTHVLANLFKEICFIYRPHPSENHDFYRTVFQGAKNIVVNHDGAVGPWILGADAVIHDGCSTALEAFIAGVPVINYKPCEDDIHDIWLPNQFGVKARSLKEAIDALEEYNQNSLPDSKTASLLANLNQASYESFVKVIDEKIEEKSGERCRPASRYDIELYYAKHTLRLNSSKILRVHGSQYYQYGETKFPGFDSGYLAEKLKTVSKILGKRIRLNYHNKLCFGVSME